MNENLKAFLQKVSEDDELKAKVSELTSSAAESVSDAKGKFIKFAEEHGYSFKEEDLDSPAEKMEQLSDDELNTAAGGKYVNGHCNCKCYAGGGGTGDDLHKTCACVLGGAGELTKLGKEKAEKGEIGYTGGGKGSDKLAMFCLALGEGQ